MDANRVLTELAEVTDVAIRTDEAGAQPGRMWVEYCADKILRVYFNNAGDTKPATPQAAVAFDMDRIFSGQDFVTGYSAATGDFTDYHDIMSWELTESCD